jgi:hypothetical protein
MFRPFAVLHVALTAALPVSESDHLAGEGVAVQVCPVLFLFRSPPIPVHRYRPESYVLPVLFGPELGPGGSYVLYPADVQMLWTEVDGSHKWRRGAKKHAAYQLLVGRRRLEVHAVGEQEMEPAAVLPDLAVAELVPARGDFPDDA